MLQRKYANKIKLYLDIFLALLALSATISIILLVGFYISDSLFSFLSSAVEIIILIFAIQEILRLFISANIKKYIRFRWFELLLAISILLNEVLQKPLFWMIQNVFANLTPHNIILIYLIISLVIMVSSLIIKALRYNHLISKIQLHPGALFSLSFGILILFGSLLLILPKATVPGSGFSFVNSVFTSTSAVCVTGLIVVDTAIEFTILGKIIILILIQIGGLGVMTITTFFALFFGSGLSYRLRIVMGDLLSNESITEVVTLLKRIAVFTFIIELIGAIQLYLSLPGASLPINQEKIFTSVFHSVSAFCNAGFSLYSNNLMNDTVINNYWYNTNIMILIILGGLGFPVLLNIFRSLIKREKGKWRNRLNLNTKVVLITSIILIATGALFLLLTDAGSTILGSGSIRRVFNSIFLSVSSRTAGFNTILVENLTPASAFLLIGLMWIGASPNSTGGGIKTTTFAVAFLYLINYIRGKEHIIINYRQVDMTTIRKAFMIIFSSLIILFTFTFILILIEPDKEVLNLIFEATSAISTVGLSMDTTFHLGTGGKWIIILLMFMGRIGILTFLLGFFKPKPEPRLKYPQEGIIM